MSDRSDTTVRLFFAAWPDAVTRERVAAAAQSLQLASQPAPVRWVAQHDYHMTLAFIGGAPASQVSVVKDVGRSQRVERFSVRFGACEYWPEPQAVVATAHSSSPALERLWRGLHEGLAPYGWGLDPKRLRPHVTLARKVSQAPVLQAMSGFDWPISEFSLIRSDTGGAQSAYTVVDTWQLLYDDAET